MPTLNLQVAAGADDAYQADDGSSFKRSTGNVECRSDVDADNRYNGGFRFTAVTIPQGATITAATLTVERINASSADPNVDIHAEDVDNAVDFVTTPDVTGRVRTTASVPWVATGIPLPATSPDFTAVVQEVIDRAGWASGNALVIFMDGKVDTSRILTVAPFEHTTLNPVKLDITYEDNFTVAIEGVIAPAGTHLGFLAKAFAGALTPSGGVLTEFITQAVALAGAITPSGVLNTMRTLAAVVAGSILPAGTLSFLIPPLRIAGRLRAYITDRDGTPRGHILP